jgi:Gas vesicle synthesis protein GvpL/GvpF
MSQLYLYGILPNPGPKNLDITGLDKQPVQTQSINDFVLLYTETQQSKYLASRRNLLGHEQVLEKAMEAGHRTLLPLQFGLIIKDWEHVTQELLAPHHDRLKSLMHKLDGFREVSVKVMWDEAQELACLMNENQALKAERDSLEGKALSMEAVIHIGQAIEAAMNERKAAIISYFQTQLSPLAQEIVENDTLTADMIYNAAYLIPWEAEAMFASTIETIDSYFPERLRIRYNNFTAPFNFAQLN